MRMNLRNIAIVAIIVTFLFVYTIHINWKQKKEIAAYSHETEVYEKHIDELTAKLNECTERKQQWGIKFENEKKRAAELLTALNAARSLVSKSQADSSDTARQANERLADLESQVKQLTDLRVGLERDNSDLRKQQQDRLTNESDALALLHRQLDRALANEKQLQLQLDAMALLATKSLPLPTGPAYSAVTDSTVSKTTLNATSAANVTLSSASNLNLTASSIANVNATKSATSKAAAAGGPESSSTMVLRPPLAANVLNNPVAKEPPQQLQDNAGAAAAPPALADDGAAI